MSVSRGPVPLYLRIVQFPKGMLVTTPQNVCPSCQGPLPLGATSCERCSQENACHSCGATLKRAMLRCRECGTTVETPSQRRSAQNGTGKTVAAARVLHDTVQVAPGSNGAFRNRTPRKTQVRAAPHRKQTAGKSVAGSNSAQSVQAANKANNKNERPRTHSAAATQKNLRSSRSRQYIVPLAVTFCLAAAAGGAILKAQSLAPGSFLSAEESFNNPLATTEGSHADRAAAEWVLEHFGVVTVKTKDAPARKFVAIEHLPSNPFVVTEVNLYGQEFIEEDLEILTELTQLRLLDLSRTQLTESGLAIAGEIQGLKKLYLRGNKLKADAFRHLKNGDSIESCSVTANYVFDDASLSVLAEVMPNLTRFSCGSTAVTAKSAEEFKRLGKLEYLALKEVEWSAHEISKLKTSLPDCRIKS